MPKTIIITGASDGIGAAAVKRLHAMGHYVVVVGRDPERTRAGAEPLGAPYHLADFLVLDDVERLAGELLANYPKMEVLANNAGGTFEAPRATTIDGHEKTFQLNYLSSWYLTDLLTERLVENQATVINTSSMAHWLMSRFKIDDLELTKGWTPERAYGNAKLAMILHARQLHDRYYAEGLKAISLHPGVINSSFATGQENRIGKLYSLARRGFATPEDGAKQLIRFADQKAGLNYPSGRYFVNGSPSFTHPKAANDELAARLWSLTEIMLASRR